MALSILHRDDAAYWREFIAVIVAQRFSIFGESGLRVFFSGVCLAVTSSCFCAVALGTELPAEAGNDSAEIWQRAISLVSHQKYWAGNVTTALVVYDAQDRLLGRIDSREELEVVGGRPIWRKNHQVKSGSPGMVITMDFGVQKNPGVALDGYDRWMLIGREKVGDDLVQVWKGISQEDARNTATAYLQEPAGWPLKVKFTIPFKVLLTTQVGSFTLEYKKVGEFGWLPWRGEIDQTGRVFFSKRRVRMNLEYTGWQRAQPTN